MQSIEAALAGRPVARPACARGSRCCGSAGSSRRSQRARKAGRGGRLDEARAAYLAAIAVVPAEPVPAPGAGRGRAAGGRLDEPRSSTRTKAVELEPDEPRTHVLLGEIYEAQGDFVEGGRGVQQPRWRCSRTRRCSRGSRACGRGPRSRRCRPSTAASRAPPTVTRGAARGAAGGAARAAPDAARARVSAVVITDTRAPLGLAVHPRRRPRRRHGGLSESHLPAGRDRAAGRPRAGREPGRWSSSPRAIRSWPRPGATRGGSFRTSARGI